MKKTINGVPVGCPLGLGLMFLEQWISKWDPFTDQEFLCGVLLGAGMVLMIQAVWQAGRMAACSKRSEK